MNNILKIIREVFQDFIKEAAGEKNAEYKYQKYGIEPEFSSFEKQYGAQQLRQNKDEIIYEEGRWKLIKNPTTLQNIGASARGVIVSNGDLYIESYGGEKIHHDILSILGQKGILPTVPKKNWVSQLPQQSGFLTVQRYKNTPYIAIGESNKLIYNELDYNQQIKYYDEFLNKAKAKNPNITFVNKLVNIKLQPNIGSNVMNEDTLKSLERVM
jgi:hypothetical protein